MYLTDSYIFIVSYSYVRITDELIGNRPDIHHLRFGMDSRRSLIGDGSVSDCVCVRAGAWARGCDTNLYSCKIKSHRRAAATRLPVRAHMHKEPILCGPGPISRSATLADAARNPVDYLLIKCLRFIGSRPDLGVARGSCNRPNLHRARETSRPSPPRTPPPCCRHPSVGKGWHDVSHG